MREVAIVGVGQTKYQFRRDDCSYTDLVFEAVTRAFEGVDIKIKDVQATVFSLAPDALSGVSNAERWCVDAVGAQGNPFMRVNTGGSTGISAVQAGFYHVASGMFDVVLVAGADRVGESGDAQTILNKMWDPFYERDLPLNAVNMLALSGVRYMKKYGMTEEHMALVAVKNRSHAVNNPYAHIQKTTTVEEVLASRMISWPIKLYDACPQSSGGCAVILCSKEWAKKATSRPAWILGVGHHSETYYLGDRMGPKLLHDHADADAKAEAIKKAYKMAGIEDPRRELQTAELYAPFTNTEFHAIDAAGFFPKGESIKLMEKKFFNMDGELPINPSGGVLCSNPIAVTAMVRVGEAALQVMGIAGKRQVPNVKKALATGNGGDHQFFGAVVVGDKL
jgi:acetyl-CoA C-acetyltransferase